jgi:hypothetical protein
MLGLAWVSEGNMRHATILDAFNAASGFTQQTLGMLTKEKEYELDTELFRQSIELERVQKELIADYTRIDENGENIFQQNPNAYQEHVQKRMAAWRRDADAAGSKLAIFQKAGGQGSRYYTEKLDRLDMQAGETMRQRYQSVKDETDRQREAVSLAKDLAAIDNAGMGIQEALAEKMFRLDLHKNKNTMDPVEEFKSRAAIFNSGFEQALAVDTSNYYFVDDALRALDDNMQNLESAAAHHLRDGESIDNFLNMKQEKLVEARQRITQEIQKKDFNFFREKQAYIDRLVISGDINGAIRECKNWGAQWNKRYNPNNEREYNNSNEDYRDRGSGFFDVGKLEGYLKQGDAGRKTALLDFYGPEMFIRPQFHGDGTVIVGYREDGSPIIERYDSIKEAMEGFISYKKEAYLYSKGGEDAATLLMWQKEEAEWFEKFYDEVGKALGQINPVLQSDFNNFRKFDTYLTEGTKDKPNEYYNKEIEKQYKNDPYARDLYAQRCVDFFKSIFFNGITDVPTIRQIMRDFTGQEIINVLQWKSTPSNEKDKLRQLKAFSDKAMSSEAEDILFRKYEPERLAMGLAASGKTPEPTYLWRDNKQQEAIENVREDERKRTADILDIPINELKLNWMDSTRRKGDVIPKGIFVVEKGEKAGTYYMGYDDNANQVVMKQNPTTKAWEEHKKVVRQPSPKETFQQYRRTQDEYLKAVRDKINPITGEEFDYHKEPPPGLTIPLSEWNRPGNRIQKDLVWANYFLQKGQE